MQKLRYGLGENSRFSACHPMVNFIFYVFVIGITMFSMSPAFLAATLCFSWAYTVLLKGVPGIKTNLLFTGKQHFFLSMGCGLRWKLFATGWRLRRCCRRS